MGQRTVEVLASAHSILNFTTMENTVDDTYVTNCLFGGNFFKFKFILWLKSRILFQKGNLADK